MRTFARLCLSAGAAVLLAGAAGAAAARTAVSVNLGFGFGYPGYYGGYPGYVGAPYGAVYGGYYRGAPYWHRGGVWYRPWGPSWVIVAPPIGYAVAPQPLATEPPPAPSVGPTKPDPIIYPRHGQSAAQTELDRQECNRWATTQPSAVADASVFQRAVEACMDGRGYSMR